MAWWNPFSWERWQKFTAGASLLAGAAYVLQIVASEHWATGSRVLIGLAGAACAGIAVWLPLREQKSQSAMVERLKKKRNEEIRAGLDKSLRDVFIPSVRYVHLVSGLPSTTRAKSEEAMKMRIIGDAEKAAKDIAGIRAAYFDFLEESQTMHLTCRGTHSGDRGAPDDFIVDTPHGAHVLNTIRQGRPVFERNLVEATVPWPGDRDFQTIVIHPVRIGSETFGVLTLDAPNAGSLDMYHSHALDALAKVLGTGILTCRPNPTP
ncbi:GAF domain-containing protein [Streptomyces olivoreticuli]